ncbi:MAG TPA: ABC transporter ATP-binding protein [Thermoanaerobaculia bacterium]|nr:ABC transporter ATP-binding protein [Thermoanaerobaculia bacterium]
MADDATSLDPRRFLGVFRYGRRALGLVWTTNHRLTLLFAVSTLAAGLLPAGAAWVGRHIVDAVVAGIEVARSGAPWREAAGPALRWIAVEGVVMAALAGVQRTLGVCQSLLQAQLGHRVNTMILEKALTLDLAHFEDSEFYDKLTRARREASSRPVALVVKTFGLIQNFVSLASFAALLVQFSAWAVVALVLAGLPAFVAEAKFSGDAFRLFRWRSPDSRKQMYLETVLANDGYAKEVQIFGLGPLFLERYREIFRRLYARDRDLTLRRGAWGFALGLIGTLAFYGAYAWIGVATVLAQITLGQMTMYLLLFKQGQSAVSASLQAIGGMYEDNLYLSNLYEYLEQPVQRRSGHVRQGALPGDGVRFEGVTFSYPGAEVPAVEDVDLHLRPGRALALVGDNGSGKTTLIKLLARLYDPEAGRILLDGTDLREWDPEVLRQRIAVIFQDFARYQLLAGENIGVGDVGAILDEEGWRQAAERGLADEFLERLPERYRTQLGRWFQGGRELSGGQWQKVALSRAFMRSQADVFVLDEPTAAMDAEAEAQVFAHVRSIAADKMVILISHRFSTVRMADHIAVISGGRVTEEGSHDELMALGGRYAELFTLQAAGYR